MVGGGTERDVGCVRAVVVVEEADAAAGAGAGALAVEGMLEFEFEDPFRRRSLRYLVGVGMSMNGQMWHGGV